MIHALRSYTAFSICSFVELRYDACFLGWQDILIMYVMLCYVYVNSTGSIAIYTLTIDLFTHIHHFLSISCCISYFNSRVD